MRVCRRGVMDLVIMVIRCATRDVFCARHAVIQVDTAWHGMAWHEAHATYNRDNMTTS